MLRVQLEPGGPFHPFDAPLCSALSRWLAAVIYFSCYWAGYSAAPEGLLGEQPDGPAVVDETAPLLA